MTLFSSMEASNWLSHLSSFLSISVEVVRLMMDGYTVVLKGGLSIYLPIYLSSYLPIYLSIFFTQNTFILPYHPHSTLFPTFILFPNPTYHSHPILPTLSSPFLILSSSQLLKLPTTSDEKGRDESCIVGCLVEMMMVEGCRTMEGFERMVQKQWCAMGYSFCDRGGFLGNLSEQVRGEGWL